VITPQIYNGNIHSYHLYVIQIDRRDELRASLEERGISTDTHYAVPLHEDVFTETSSAPHSVYRYAHRDFLEDVMKCINCNKQALIEGLVGRKSLELITAIYESCESQQEVRLRFQPRLSRQERAIQENHFRQPRSYWNKLYDTSSFNLQ